VLEGADAAAARDDTNAAGSPLARHRNNELANVPDGHCAVLRFPIGARLGEPRTSPHVAHVVFRSGGREETEFIALHHIATLDLSLVSLMRGKK